MLFCLTNKATDTIYLYKYLFANEERIQSSWSKWVFDGEIYGAGFIGSYLYLLMRRGTQITMEQMDFSVNIKEFDDTEVYRVYLDQKKVMDNGVYDAVSEQTKFDLKALYAYTDTTPLQSICVVTHDGVLHENLKADDAGCIYLDGNFAGKKLVVGEPYLFKAIFTTFYLKRTTMETLAPMQKAGHKSRTSISIMIIQVSWLAGCLTSGQRIYVSNDE